MKTRSRLVLGLGGLAILAFALSGCILDGSSASLGRFSPGQTSDSVQSVAQLLCDNGQLLVANRDSANPGVAVVDTGTGLISAYYSETIPPSAMAVTADGQVVVTETNYAQGAVSVLNLADKTLQKNASSFGSDNFVDTAGGATYLFDHTTGVVTGFTGHVPTANIVLNAQTGAGSNPYDIAVTGGKAYIPRYNSKWLLILDATQLGGGTRDSIDLSAYVSRHPVDTAASAPRMASVTAYNGTVFVALQRLNYKYSALDTSLVLAINAATKAVTVIPLRFRNPVSAHVSGSYWYLTGLSGYGDQLGGVERIDLSAKTNAGAVVSEQTLGGDVFDFVATGPHSGYAAVSTDYGYTTRIKKVSF